MLRRRWLIWVLLSQFAFAGAERKSAWPERKTLPITTSSPQARKSFDRAMRNFEDYRINETLDALREAIKADPKFAQALILVAKITRDPAEQAVARRRAQKLASKVTPGEALLIKWLADAEEDNYLPAIAAMNDLLSMYPEDARLAFLAGDWLILQGRNEQSRIVLQHALTLHPEYPAALNDLAYSYAYAGDFANATASMERYVALEPEQPNPRDSYGEILRMAGKFDAALAQYRISVRMDPNFGSEVGVADTLALMGREAEARDEYERAIVFAGSQSEKIQFELQMALTWIREGDRKQAERALTDVAKHAHSAELCTWEAEAQRVLAIYEPDSKLSFQHLIAAERALEEPHEISMSDRNDEEARVYLAQAVRAADFAETGIASQATDQLERLAAQSRSRVVQLSYEGAVGASLVAHGNYKAAIPHLQENGDDPLSLRMMWIAYDKMGASDKAHAVAARLAGLNIPTIEQALVAAQFHGSLVSQATQP